MPRNYFCKNRGIRIPVFSLKLWTPCMLLLPPCQDSGIRCQMFWLCSYMFQHIWTQSEHLARNTEHGSFKSLGRARHDYIPICRLCGFLLLDRTHESCSSGKWHLWPVRSLLPDELLTDLVNMLLQTINYPCVRSLCANIQTECWI